MDANLLIGSAMLLLAVVSGVFLAAIVLAASNVSEQLSSKPLYGPGDRGAHSPRGRGPLAAPHSADCYYECMNGFHWSSDWGSMCGEACGTSRILPKG